MLRAARAGRRSSRAGRGSAALVLPASASRACTSLLAQHQVRPLSLCTSQTSSQRADVAPRSSSLRRRITRSILAPASLSSSQSRLSSSPTYLCDTHSSRAAFPRPSRLSSSSPPPRLSSLPRWTRSATSSSRLRAHSSSSSTVRLPVLLSAPLRGSSLTLLACSLAEKVLVHLRDDRKLIGVLRSYDQYGASPLRSFLPRPSEHR